ncbi:MAG: hypothetical protein IJ122_05935 [Methanobrevibacter sp.]|nr:hypothetical protein [Methanobrevibacter sp.]
MEKNTTIDINSLKLQLSLEEIKSKKQMNTLIFIASTIFMLFLLTITTYLVCFNIQSKSWLFAIIDAILIIIDIFIFRHYILTYKRNKSRLTTKTSLVKELYSGKYDKELSEIAKKEDDLHLLELQLSSKVVQNYKEDK